MLKTAAMTLLSKTLSTVLYKYIEDVDVEGVALPSVYDGSGWGVRLSNVKLREGVQLMAQLPGKRKRKRKKAKTKAKAKAKVNHNVVTEKEAPLFTANSSTPKASNTNTQKQQPQPQPQPKGTTTTDDGDDHSIQLQEILPITSQQQQQQQQDEYEYEYDGDEEGDGAKTPIQDSKSFFSCFSASRSNGLTTGGPHPPIPNLNDNHNDNHNHNHDDPNDNTIISSLPQQRRDNHRRHQTTQTTPKNDSKLSLLDQETSSPSPCAVEESSFSSPLVLEEEQAARQSPLGNDDDDDEEYEEYEQPVKLCLGENGRIGTLDIRLIGKELHVMVEDAVLTIEAIPIDDDTFAEDHHPTENGDETAAGDTADAASSTTADDAASTTTSGTYQPPPSKSSTHKTTKPTKPTPPKRATVGERVLADIPLAKLISAIPHLFLRDIRVRLIVRDEPTTTTTTTTTAPSTSAAEESSQTSEAEDQSTDAPTNNNNNNNNNNTTNNNNHPNPNDTMVEIGIEFLSVTSGEDILSHFQEQQEDESNHMDEDPSSSSQSNNPLMMSIPSFHSVESTSGGGGLDQNEYLVRHIRTGRGPSAGIWVQVFAPGPKLPPFLLEKQPMIDHPTDDYGGRRPTPKQWARQHWIAMTEFHLLRCSGLDLRARIHLGTKKEVARFSWFYDEDYEGTEEYYDDFTMDSLILGADYICPGPQLPPMQSPSMGDRGDTAPRESSTYGLEEETAKNEVGGGGTEIYFVKDQNGIQSCNIPSSFHRIARGMLPGSCQHCKHLPSEVCSLCWETTSADNNQDSSTLDDSMPMPGLALQLTFRDPLEINADRTSLETVGLLRSLFQKETPKEPISDDEASPDEAETDKNIVQATHTLPAADEASTHATASTSYFAGLYSSKKEEEPVEPDPSDAFAPYMQPENIQVMGIHLSEVLIRVHVMKPDKTDDGMSFCYWDFFGTCLTLDRHALLSSEKMFQDLELDVGHFTWDEYRGTSQNQLLSLGITRDEKNRNRCDSNEDFDERHITPWPTTACALLEIPAPLETLIYRDREQHGLQLGFVSVVDQQNDKTIRSRVNARLGLTSVVVPFGFWRGFGKLAREIDSCISIQKQKEEAPGEEPVWNSGRTTSGDSVATATESVSLPKPKSLMKYTIQIDGGSLKIHPVLNAKVPLTQFSGEQSSESGIFFETMLEKLQLSYGQKEPSIKKGLSIQQLAALPESLRMRILLCLENLEPLEEALQLKKETNSFRRCRSVNKGIVKIAKKMAKAAKASGKKHLQPHREPSSIGRQEIMTQLMKLDDSELDELWSVHQKHQRKLAKKRISQS